MALDSLGLGLTLDTTLLEKADKTLENMQKNSKLIMQNLTRGFTAFNEGKIGDFTKVFENMSKAMDKINNTTVSLDFDTSGLQKGLGYISQVTTEIEKMQRTGAKQFFNPNELYTTMESTAEVSSRLNNLYAYAEKLGQVLKILSEYPQKIRETENEIAKIDSLLKGTKAGSEKNNLYSQQKLEAETALNEMRNELAETKRLFGDLDSARIAERGLKEIIEITQQQLAWTKKTKAEQLAAITSYNNKIIADEKARTKEVETLYRNNFAEMQKISKAIAQLEADREKIAKGGGDTTEQDMNLAFYRDQLQKRRDLEVEIASSGYQKIAKIKEELNAKAFLDSSKQQVKDLQTEVSFANRFSKNAKSVEEERQAIELLRSARNNLSQDTAHYSQIVEALNKRILTHKDHIESVTREEKEQNTLADSVINRYRKQLKALDDVNEALEKQMKIERKTSIADLDPTNADTQALLARQKTIADDIADIESNAQGQLDTIREQHEAERAKKRIDETLRQNEREKQEYAKLLDDLYALEKQKKAMEDAGAKVGDKAYDNILQQEVDLNNRISQLRAKHQNDLDEIDKRHAKKRNDDDVKAFIAAEKEKQKAALESLKKRVANEKKYGTISGATAERLISFTDNATNAAQHKRAIDSLQKARERLNNTDKDYLKTVKRLNEAIKYHEIEIELTDEKSKNLMQTHRGLMDIGGQLMRRLALVFSVSQLTQYFRKLVEVRGEFEKTEVALTTILKSRAQANVLMNQITDLAVKSPFTLQQLVGYTKQLAAYQIEYKKLYSTTKMLADVSSGLGVEMDRLILAFGQVKAANFLRATEVRQFTEAGFNILGELAKYYSELKGEMVSVGEVQEMVTKRMVGFADVEKVFQKVTSAGGIFYDMQAKQAETLAGQWSNLQDKISIMYNEIGKSTDGMLKGIVGFLASLIDNWEEASTVLKSLVATFAMVKINSMLASKEMIKFARTMNVIKGRRNAVTIVELFHAGFVKLGRSIKSAGAALKAFVVRNPYIAAIAAVAGVIGAVVSKHHKQAEAVKEVSKRYDELHESITNVNSAMLNAVNKQDLEKQKDALKELVEMVDKEYNMKVNIDIESLTPEEIAAKFNEIRDEAEKLNIFGALFGSGLEGYKASGMLTNSLLKDATQYGEAANELFKQMVDKSAMVASALQEIDAEKYKDIIKDLVTPRDIMGGESELTYLNRLYEAYNKIKEESGIDLIWDEDTDRYIARTSENFYVLGKILDEIDFKSLSTDYASALKEFKDVEFIKYLDTLENSLKGLTDEQKEKKLKFAIDTEAAHREWNAFVVQLMYEIANTKFGLSIKPEVEAPDVTQWEKWQENYKEKFEKEEGYMPITSPSITQEAQIKALNEEYKKLYELLERIKNAGGESALEVGGAYEGLGKTMGEISSEMEDLNAQIEYLGGTNTTIDKNEKASQKILNRRISILKEIHEAYKQARKDDLGREEAIQKVMKDWGDTFKEAFEGTSINLSSLVVDKDKLNELKNSAKEAGTVFSENMEAAMQEVFDNNTYIRESNEAAEEFTKSWESAILKAKDVEGKGIAYTIGYGEYDVYKDTGKKIQKGDTITQGEAEERFTKVVYPKYVAALNKILDVNKDLIFTQDQYNALLDVTYQGGKGATEKLLLMARDEEKGIAYIESIRKKIAETFGDEKASRFGEEFVQKFKEAENIYERIALLMETTNLTVSNQIDKNLYRGMQSRSDARAAMFSGDTIISNLLQQASQTIADFDFATPEGLVKALRGLVPIAKKEGKEAMLALSKEISKVENEFGVKIRLENVEDFKTDIEKTLGDYKLWKDIEKLQMPDDIASKIFGVTPQTLQQVREKVLNALNLGDDINLGNEEDILAAVKLQYGDPTLEVVRNFFKNINQIQRSETEEQAKRFVKFLTKKLDQTKVVLEQKGIDISYAKSQFDEGAISAQNFAEVVREITKQANEDISKINFEKFKDSSLYIKAMGNLAAYSKKELDKMTEALSKVLAENAKNMSTEELEAYHKALERIRKEQEKFDPFIRDNEIAKIKELIKLEKELANEEKNRKELEGEKVSLEQQRTSLLRLIEEAQSKGNAGNAQSTQNLQNQLLKTEGQIQQVDSLLANSEMKISNISGQIGNITGGAISAIAMIDMIVQAVNDTCNAAKKTFEDIMSMADSFGVETDKGSWREASMFFEGMSNFNAEVTEGWENLKSGNIMGTIANTIGSIVGFIRDVNKWIDSNLEEALQEHLEEVERLEKEYERLERAIDKAFAFERYGKVTEQTSNLAEQAQNLNKAIALEEDKKDTDPERIKELKDQVEDIENQVEDLFDNLKQELIGSFEDMGDSLADAMIEAFKAGEDGLEAWNKEVDSIIAELVKKLTVQKYLEPQISAAIDTLFSKMMPKTAAAEKAAEKYGAASDKAVDAYKKAEGELPQLDKNAAEEFKRNLELIGLSYEEIAKIIAGITGGEAGGLSALQKGISGITEQQAEILTAYWNSVRGYTASIDSKMDLILANMGVGSENNPMLEQLRSQTGYLKTIKDVLSGASSFEARAIWVKLAGQK